MKTSLAITWIIIITTFSVTTMNAQTGGNLNRVWELNSMENLGVGMGSIDEGMKRLDFRHETQLVFQGGGQSVTLNYKIIDQEVRLFDKDDKQLSTDIVWKIERLTEDELYLLLIAREEEYKKELVRLKYRAKG
jgi:hypothetical protein